jgi:biotin transport system substrate-specific component
MQSSISPSFGAAPVEVPFIDTLRKSFYGRIFLAVSATAFVAVCAHVTLPLPYTPVPLVLSDFAVLLVGMVLGPVAGFWAMVLYLAEGAAGLPVFSPQGPGGIFQLMGHTGGYLFSYPIAAAITGLTGVLARKGSTAFTSAVLTGTVAIAVILACGATWLSHLGFGNSSTWSLAVTPFLFGSLAKIVAAAIVFSSTRRWLCPQARH